MTETRNPKISKLTIERVCSINDDLLIQVLVRLPLKPLFQFKSVCKHWNSIISDPKIHLIMRNQVHRAARGLIFQKGTWNRQVETRVIVSLDDSSSSSSNPPPLAAVQTHITKYIPETLRIIHSCNGLLLLKHTNHDYYYVYNPTTNQKTGPLLTDEIEARQLFTVSGMYLAFDPSKSPHYKVVCVWDLNDQSSLFQLGVYSSETRSCEVRSGHVITVFAHFQKGIYWNGAINLMSLFGGESFYLNPDDDMPRAMPALPHHHFVLSRFVDESCGHLHCVVVVGACRSKNFADQYHIVPGIFVYEMRRDYSEWFLKYKVDELCTQRLEDVFGVVRGGKEDELVMGTKEGEIVRYNLANNTVRTIIRPKDFSLKRTDSFQYIECPCSV